jgi:hypothetical protein
MFQWTLSEARASGKFPDETVRKKGRVAATLALKIVVALRYLATGCSVDTNEEASSLGRSTMSEFHHGFFACMVRRAFLCHMDYPEGTC